MSRKSVVFRKIVTYAITLSVVLSSLIWAAPQPVSAGLTLPVTADYGDAPQSVSGGSSMTAYAGVDAHFPTLFLTNGSTPIAQGPKHLNAAVRYVLGRGASAEALPDSGLDHDGVPNIDPAANVADQDGRDDGFGLPSTLGHCEMVELRVAVSARDVGQSYPERALVNVWLDLDRSGRWGETYTCPGGAVASEWAVQNHIITLPAAGMHVITLPAALMWNEKPNMDMWARVSVSDASAPSADGRGPEAGYTYGETEDYLLDGVGTPPESVTLPPMQVADLKSNAQIPFVQLPFVSLPAGPWTPDDFKVPDANLTEVDMAHIGGNYGSPTPPYAVTVAGTGWSGKFASWNLNNPLGAPILLQDGPVRIGYNHQIHVLTPDVAPKLAHEVFVTGLIRDDTLWLTTWRLTPNGHFIEMDTRGYGPDAGVAPQHYTMAHRVLQIGGGVKRFQLVTPVLHDNGKLRLVSWEVNAVTGTINGRQDSGDVANNVAPGSDLSAAWVAGGVDLVPQHYIVSMQNMGGQLMNSLWEVDGAGVPTLRGMQLSGRDIQDSTNIAVNAQNVAIAPLNDTGFLSAVNAGSVTNPQLRMHTWENLTTTCNAEAGCNLASSNISDNSLDLQQAGLGVQISLPSVVTQRVMVYDPMYEDEVYATNENDIQAIASVRKVMVTIVALDAVADGDASLDDPVTVSAAAANVNNTGASNMGLQEGEVMSLRHLLYGNLMVSAGDATWAISEHIGGDLDGMVDLMNAKAAELSLPNTLYCRNPASQGFSSVAYSTAEAQALLWASVYDDPQFIHFAGASSQDVCGTLPGGEELCHPAIPPMTKNLDVYPNTDGHKTGGGGGLCTGNGVFDNFGTCPSGGCVTVQATRLDRPLVISELQPSGQPANRWPDAVTLFDYGFRTIFTPDFVTTSGGQAGQAIDFAVDAMSDTHAASVKINGSNGIQLCNWSMFVGTSQLTQTGCVARNFTGMPAGDGKAPATKLDLVRISTLEAEGDYLLGRMDGSSLVLRLWRVGEKDF